VADACHAQGALLLLDVSQSCGAVPLDVNQLGADFAVCAGYKWLLGPHGTGFFWARTEHLEAAPPGPFYWMAQEGETFSALNFVDPRPSRSARRWDAAEATTDFNLNVIAMDASVDFVKRVGPEAVLEHNHRLIDALFDRLPEQCVAATPRDRNRRGPYGCFRATTAERTAALYEQLRQEKIVVSLRAGSIRVSPHLFNSVDDIDRVIRVVS
jgi:selenocysteine lyase/cysteine desulfurase